MPQHQHCPPAKRREDRKSSRKTLQGFSPHFPPKTAEQNRIIAKVLFQQQDLQTVQVPVLGSDNKILFAAFTKNIKEIYGKNITHTGQIKDE
jgi:hypothetical protein